MTTDTAGLLREALHALIEPFRRLHDNSVDMTNFTHSAGALPERCSDCQKLVVAERLLAAEPSGPVERDHNEPDAHPFEPKLDDPMVCVCDRPYTEHSPADSPEREGLRAALIAAVRKETGWTSGPWEDRIAADFEARALASPDTGVAEGAGLDAVTAVIYDLARESLATRDRLVANGWAMPDMPHDAEVHARLYPRPAKPATPAPKEADHAG